ncbi:MAG: glycosyl hydrolase-related protein, partial [Clostridia bacterium]|nr:glycosyl hydrolase-related protein [Clostridia bacterium]
MVFDLSTVLSLALDAPVGDFAAGKATRALEKVFPLFILDPVHHTLPELEDSARKISALLAPVLEKGMQDESRGFVGVIGHSHMDTAWLWPMSETIRKCARTYSEAVTLMDLYPDYSFMQSSSLHMYWMKKYYPALYERIREKVKEGRYDMTGGVWVECDCNITGGEAMVRQFLYGQKFTREEFGYEMESFWLPDTFGYSASTPQIMRGCNVKYFFTTKISWNELNKFPADTFVWKGIDGSAVLTHFNRMHTMTTPKEIFQTAEAIADPLHTDSKLMAYGFGDGGGGPTPGMMEYLKRVIGLPGLPVVKPVTPEAFMKERVEPLEESLATYEGELYLEFHRGTLTSIHNIKRNNRLAEIALHDLEFFAALSGKGAHPETERLWKILLQNQFHDILPGSSIPEVNDTAIKEVTALLSEATGYTGEYLDEKVAKDESKVTFFNTLSFERNKPFAVPGTVTLKDYPTENYEAVTGEKRTLVGGLALPAFGAETAALGKDEKKEKPFEFDANKLETPIYTAVFDENGYIASLTDKRTGREVKHEGGLPLGAIMAGEDMPSQYENWETESDFEEKLFPVSVESAPEIVSDGALSFRVRNRYAIGKASHAVVDTVFYANDPEIDYEMSLDWHEKRTLLKAAFDVNVKSRTVRNEIQYGHLERPTTRNNSWDDAKYEVVNHKWSDISETRYGVALLNDCKYGISARGTLLMLSLHKGGQRPDYRADEGLHTMRYALLPHVGGFSSDNVVKPAYAFNYPVFMAAGALCEPMKKVVLSESNVIVEAVKSPEDGGKGVVLRLYECEGAETRTALTWEGMEAAEETNMLEENARALAVENNAVTLNFHPFEIKTVRIL